MGEGKELELHLKVAEALGAKRSYAERITVYVPNKGKGCPGTAEEKEQVEFEDWPGWVARIFQLLGQINDGATALPMSQGFYITTGRKHVREKTILVYSFLQDRDHFLSQCGRLRALLHEFGRKTRQERIFLEFGDAAIAIEEPFDEK